MDYYSAIKKNEIIPFAITRIQLEITTLCEESQKEKDKCPLHVEPKNCTNELINKMETDFENL